MVITGFIEDVIVVTEAEVAFAYRLMLGREPESTAVVAAHAAKNGSLDELRRTFLDSDEFRINHARPYPLNGPPLSIEVDVRPDVLKSLLARVERLFQHYGETDPHWSILSAERFRRTNIRENEKEFFDSGWGSLQNMLMAARRCSISIDPTWTCFELGCGLGRVTHCLAKTFSNVIGADVSAPHLLVARETAKRFGCSNVELIQLNRVQILDVLPAFDVFFSIIVLQHNTPPVIAYFLRKILSKLRPGGIGYFQLPVYQAGYSFDAEKYLDRPQVIGNPEMHVMPQNRLFDLLAESDCHLLELREDGMTGPGFVSNAIFVRKKEPERACRTAR